MKINKQENELLFVLSMLTFIIYGAYALLSLVVISFIPIFISLILLTSLLLSVFLIINYEINFNETESESGEQEVTVIKTKDSLIRI